MPRNQNESHNEKEIRIIFVSFVFSNFEFITNRIRIVIYNLLLLLF